MKLHFEEAGTGPLVLLIHGWPESAFAWRHQLPALAKAGFRAVAPDLRGVGSSPAPPEASGYDLKTTLADLIELLDTFGEERAAIVGHDWGATTAWAAAALHPARFHAVAGLSVPYFPRAPMPPTKLFEAMFGERWFYVLHFQRPDAEVELEADVERSLRIIYAGTPGFDTTAPVVQSRRRGAGFFENVEAPAQLPQWLGQAELAHATRELKRTGFTGGLNRYRNMDRDWHELPALGVARIEQPALFLVGADDPGRATAPVEPMRGLVSRLEELVIPAAGHWLPQERPLEVNEALVRFLTATRR